VHVRGSSVCLYHSDMDIRYGIITLCTSTALPDCGRFDRRNSIHSDLDLGTHSAVRCAVTVRLTAVYRFSVRETHLSPCSVLSRHLLRKCSRKRSVSPPKFTGLGSGRPTC